MPKITRAFVTTNKMPISTAWHGPPHARLQDPSMDGNFYIADYGIKVEASTDMLVGWRGADFSGTTLPDVDPTMLEVDNRLNAAFARGPQSGV
jgi:hypothetical protein